MCVFIFAPLNSSKSGAIGINVIITRCKVIGARREHVAVTQENEICEEQHQSIIKCYIPRTATVLRKLLLAVVSVLTACAILLTAINCWEYAAVDPVILALLATSTSMVGTVFVFAFNTSTLNINTLKNYFFLKLLFI